MNSYLVVLDKSVSAQTLRYGLLNIVSQNKPVELVLLQTPERLPGETAEEARRAARGAVMATKSVLASMSLPVVDAVVGDPLPKKAIAEELSSGRRAYTGILLTSKMPGVLRLLHFDLASQLERKHRLPVLYVEKDVAGKVAVA